MNNISPEQKPIYQQIFNKPMLICIFTGFTSGLPLYFIISLLPVWLRIEHISLKEIGAMSLIQLPYVLKFLWAPFMDGFSLPFLGRRRGWLLVTQIALLLLMSAYAFVHPSQNLRLIIIISIMLAFFSATQDIVIDAYRRELLSDAELGLGNAIHVNAYRIASLIPGSLSLILVSSPEWFNIFNIFNISTTYFSYPQQAAWANVFIITALFMLPGLLMTLLVKEPEVTHSVSRSLQETVVKPFMEFFTRKGVNSGLLILLFIFLYKLGDSMATALASPFYLDMGYSAKDIGLVAKNAGLWTMIIFGILGGILMLKIGINKALWLFGIVQMVTILGFVWLSSYGHFAQIGNIERMMLAAVVAAEAAGIGLGTAAFVAFIARETNPMYTATQLALLTALSAVPRTVINASTGYLIASLGYTKFFLLCFFLAIPGMILLYKVAPWKRAKVKI